MCWSCDEWIMPGRIQKKTISVVSLSLTDNDFATLLVC